MSNLSYLTHCLKNDKLLRWSENCMPLKVYVAPFRWYKEKDQEYFYYAMVKEAFEIWKNASNQKISFVFVDNLYNSQINIEWKRVDRTSLGHCLFNFDNDGRLFSAEINIGLSDGLIHKQYEDKNEVKHTIIHEVGHALGLNHSPFPDDIMYVPHQYGVTSVSKRDMLTLKWLYGFPVGSTKDDILLKHKIDRNYDLDDLIYLLENPKLNNDKKFFEKTKSETPSQTKSPEMQKEEFLHYEQKTLSEINKYNLNLQNITVSSDKKEYLKKIKIKKDLEEKG